MLDTNIDPLTWKHISDLELVDPTFTSPGKMNVMIDADIYPFIGKYGRIFG